MKKEIVRRDDFPNQDEIANEPSINSFSNRNKQLKDGLIPSHREPIKKRPKKDRNTNLRYVDGYAKDKERN